MKHLMYCLLFSLAITPLINAQEHLAMTINIRFDSPNDGINKWENRKNEVVALLRYYQPGIVGTQEGLKHQLKVISDGIPNYKMIGVGRDDGKEKGEFSALFYDTNQYKLLGHNTFWLSETPDKISIGWDASMERICTYGLFEDRLTKTKFYVFNAHFDHIGKEAREQSAKLITRMAEKINTTKIPVLVMGDFNSEPTDTPILHFNSVMNDSYSAASNAAYGPVGTFSGFNKNQALNRRIDYVFTTNDIDVTHYRAIDDRRPDGNFISDHLPVLIKYSFTAK